VEVAEDGVAPFLPLPPAFDEYLARLPAKLRHEIRRKARRLEAAVGERRLVHSAADTLDRDLGMFVDWHRASEGPKGVFMVPGMEIFFRRLGEVFLPSGVFRLSFLEAAGRRLAGVLGFRFRRRHYLYNSAFDPTRRDVAPGMVLIGDLIANAIADGCEAMDMLKGDLQYKFRFGALRRAVRRLVLARS
jgi:CelD/BcsL family acetyltransferase involved in cellulose biosynthesis